MRKQVISSSGKQSLDPAPGMPIVSADDEFGPRRFTRDRAVPKRDLRGVIRDNDDELDFGDEDLDEDEENELDDLVLDSQRGGASFESLSLSEEDSEEEEEEEDEGELDQEEYDEDEEEDDDEDSWDDGVAEWGDEMQALRDEFN